MSITAWDATHAPPLQRSLERFRGALLWLTAFSGAFVFMEPSPYEATSLLTMIVFALTGIALRASLMPLVLMLVLYCIGFAIAVLPLLGQSKLLIWVLVSWYLSATAIFFAAALGTNTEERLSLLTRGFMIAGVVAAVAGIGAYFRLFGGLSDLFLKFDRARGTFNDPNVLGAFLVFPALLALQRVMNGTLAQTLRAGVALTVLVMALLLSFSRAAWGQFAATAALLMFLTLITSRSSNERLRIVVIAVLGAAFLALLLAALLSLDRVADLFRERANLEQGYDLGHMGRFGRYVLGFILALDHPFGIGPLQFGLIFPEDPHNTFLNTFMSGGWLTGCVYLALTVTTLIMGLRFVFVHAPWRPTYLATYCAFVGVAGESVIIDTDHWRHYFLLLGMVWGLMAATRAHGWRRAGEQHAIPAGRLATAPA